MKCFCTILAAAAATAGIAAAQPSGRLIPISVLAGNQNGPVLDLKKEDFTLLGNGKPRAIAVAELHTRAADEDKVQKALARRAPNLFNNSHYDSTSGTILLLDERNTGAKDQRLVRAQIARLLADLPAGSRLGVCYLGDRFRVIHDLTVSPQSLNANLDAFFASDHGQPAVSSERDMLVATADALRAIAHHLEGMTGRKNLVWVSSAFPIFGLDEEAAAIARTALETLEAANVAVYPVEGRELMTSVGGLPAVPAAALEQLAKETGGRAFYKPGEVWGAVRKAVEDAGASYTLGFLLSGDEMDRKRHELQVTVNYKGVQLSARSGYTATPEPLDKRTLTDAGRGQMLAEAVDSPLDSSSLPMAFRLDRADRTKPGAIGMVAFVNALPFVLTRTAAGRFTGTVQVVVVQQAADGTTLDTINDTVEMNLTPETLQRILSRGFEIRKLIEPVQGAKRIQVVVLDQGSGRVGSARGSLEWILAQPPQPNAPMQFEKPKP